MRVVRRWASLGLLTVGIGACAGSSAAAKRELAQPPTPMTDSDGEGAPPASPPEPEASAAGSSQQTLPALPTTSGDPAKLPVEPPLAPEVNAGVISRRELKAVLARGIGHFLQDVPTEPLVVKGRFGGFRILGLFADQPGVRVAVLRPGDTVLRANGQSIERPEAFQSVWNGMATAKELVLEIERGGHPAKLRYTISD